MIKIFKNMNKFYIVSIVAVLILIGAGCGRTSSVTNGQPSGNQASQDQPTNKPITSKNSQELANDMKSALAQVFGGEVKLTSNAALPQELKGSIALTFGISRNPTESDAEPLISAFAELGYKKLNAEITDDPYFGRMENLFFSGSPYYLGVDYYFKEKSISIMLMPAKEAEKALKEN